MRRFVVGVMGGAQVSRQDYEKARRLGELIAEEGWVLLNGGRNAGIMLASAEGAKSRGGLTIGILPGENVSQANPFIDIAVATGMGSARNVINVLSSDVVAACRGGAGTLSEIALALKSGKTVILLDWSISPLFAAEEQEGRLISVHTAEGCIEQIRRFAAARPY